MVYAEWTFLLKPVRSTVLQSGAVHLFFFFIQFTSFFIFPRPPSLCTVFPSCSLLFLSSGSFAALPPPHFPVNNTNKLDLRARRN